MNVSFLFSLQVAWASVREAPGDFSEARGAGPVTGQHGGQDKSRLGVTFSRTAWASKNGGDLEVRPNKTLRGFPGLRFGC